MSQSSNGRILRPRQFVPVPAEWLSDGRFAERYDGKLEWIGRWRHPEISDLVRRHEALMGFGFMSDTERAISNRIEHLLLFAEDNFTFWFDRIDQDRLLPDCSAERPAPEAVINQMPSWPAFFALIGAIHRARAWIEAIERRNGIEHENATDVWARAFGVSVEDVRHAND